MIRWLALIALLAACEDPIPVRRPDSGLGDIPFVNGCPSWENEVEAYDPSIESDRWEGFPKTFLESWCERCHSSVLGREQRNGAPQCRYPDGGTVRDGGFMDGGTYYCFNWDVELDVRRDLPEIRRRVGVLNSMPPISFIAGAPRVAHPPCSERRRFLRWIDRGAPPPYP